MRSFSDANDSARAVFVPEFLEVDALVAPDGDEVVIALFIVTHEQILGVGLRVGERHVREFGHVVDRFVLRDLVPDPARAQEIVNFRFVHAASSCVNCFSKYSRAFVP